MPDPAQQYANKKFAKQGLNPHSAGQGPSVGDEEIFGHQSDVTDASGHKLGEVTRASEDTNIVVLMITDFIRQLYQICSEYMYGAAVKKYSGGN